VDRVLASEAKGRGFDPRQPHQSITPPKAQAHFDPICKNIRPWVERAGYFFVVDSAMPGDLKASVSVTGILLRH
jgi:hypothetical protein